MPVNETPKTFKGPKSIGAVAIGRNESRHLPGCIASLREQVGRMVYVDSGSTDGSPDLARSLGCEVVELDPAQGFTAARGRNAGFFKLMEIDPSIAMVQFIDGDCELAENWVQTAATHLEQNSKVSAVCGRRKERFPENSSYNRLCDIEWNTPVGERHTCGGDVLIRAEALLDVGGYNPALIAGEEPEMCFRMRQKGWAIHRIAAEMTVHDAALTRFSQWWQRNRRNGHAIAEAFADKNRDDPGLKRTYYSNILWALPPAWVLWPALWWRISRKYDGEIATLMVLAKLPHLQGQIGYLFRKKRKKNELIEYK